MPNATTTISTIKITPDKIKAGDKILPPAREVNLWMKKSLVEKGLKFDALFLTVAEVIPGGKVDKGGPWFLIKANYSQEFSNGSSIRFFVRPTTTLTLKIDADAERLAHNAAWAKLPSVQAEAAAVIKAHHAAIEQPKAHPAIFEIPIQRIRLVAEDVARYDQGVESLITHDQVEKLFRPLFAGASGEEMWVTILDSASRPICIYKAGFGTDNQCTVYPKEIMKAILLAGGSSFVMAHNHPSGDGRPSHPDRELTRVIQAAALALGVRCLDHVIITNDSCFSFRKEGLI